MYPTRDPLTQDGFNSHRSLRGEWEGERERGEGESGRERDGGRRDI